MSSRQPFGCPTFCQGRKWPIYYLQSAWPHTSDTVCCVEHLGRSASTPRCRHSLNAVVFRSRLVPSTCPCPLVESRKTAGSWCHVLASIAFDGTDTFREGLDGWEVFAYDVSLLQPSAWFAANFISEYHPQMQDPDLYGKELVSARNYPDVARLASVFMILKKVA